MSTKTDRSRRVPKCDASSAPPRVVASRRSRGRYAGREVLYGSATIVALLGLWELTAWLDLVNVYLLPPPSSLADELLFGDHFHFLTLDYASSGARFHLLGSVASSMFRVLAGVTLGFAAGVSVGCAICYFQFLRYTAFPVVRLLAPISPIAWLPLAVVFLGIGNKPAVFIVFIGVFFLIAVATVACVRDVDPLLVNTAKTLGASRRQVMLRVALPAILPSLFLVLRINLFAAWMSVLAAEMVGVSQGLGAIVMVGRALFNVRVIFVAMILIGLAGFLLDRLLQLVQQRALWWKQEASVA